ncbi:MAG: glycosyltransferase family 2 protein [Rhodoferax sp.]|uniref:glycosyltransferase family 2 protein n=1 Tax=Rhodoferax sp. TaxID=50421 RepID=UPI003BAE92B2
MKSAVLFLVFNRPDTTRQVFEAIRAAQPPRLYVAADGPRPQRAGEVERCTVTRQIATAVDWPCEVTTFFREKNLGCKHAVSSAITWFFEHEEQGIILEDDCLPAQSFFRFCDELLERYKTDTRVWQISGSTFFPEAITKSDADYFYTRYGPIWGWASWRRAWQHYDPDLKNWPEMSRPEVMQNVYPDKVERVAKLSLGTKLFNSEIDTWDYQWGFTKNFNHALTIVPKLNQIVNIGFGDDATHTFGIDQKAPKKSFNILDIKHPKSVYADRHHEIMYAKQNFQKKNIVYRVIIKIKNKLS